MGLGDEGGGQAAKDGLQLVGAGGGVIGAAGELGYLPQGGLVESGGAGGQRFVARVGQ